MMNIAPEPEKILDLETALAEATEAGGSSDALIQQALTLLQAAWSAIEHLRVYAITTDDILVAISATDQTAIDSRTTQDALIQEGAYVLPLADDYWLAAWLDASSADGEGWLRLLAEPLAAALRKLRDPQTAFEFEQVELPAAQVPVLRALNELAAVIAKATTEDDMLNHSVRLLVKTLGLDYGQVCRVVAGEGGQIVSEFPAEGNVGRRLSTDDFLLRDLDELDRAKVIANVSTSGMIPEHRRTALVEQQVNSMLLLPLSLHNELAAYVRLDSRDAERPVSQDMVEIGHVFLAQMIVGLQNIRLLNESRRRSDQLQQLSGFAQALQFSLEIPAVLRTALDETQHILPVEWLQILLHDGAADSLREAALFSLHSPTESHLLVDKGPSIALGERMLATRAWKNQAFLHVSDASRASWVLAPSAAGLRSWLVAPLRSSNKHLGIASLGHSQPFAYSETDGIVFQQMADQLATAIDNALLYERNQRGARNEALINNIAGRLQQQTEVARMLESVAKDLGTALGARQARIRLGTQYSDAAPVHEPQDAVD